jgi:hypothetical protein
MYKPRGLSDATGYPVGAGAGGPKGSLAPADPSSVAEGDPLRGLATHRGAAPFRAQSVTAHRSRNDR